MIMVPVPVMRGLLAQPRATVQVDRWIGRETEPAHGVKRQGPNGFPPTTIMTGLSNTGTHNQDFVVRRLTARRASQRLRPVVMGPRLRGDDRGALLLLRLLPADRLQLGEHGIDIEIVAALAGLLVRRLRLLLGGLGGRQQGGAAILLVDRLLLGRALHL